MKKIVIIGAGSMGSAFTLPCVDNRNRTFLIGTHLEDKLINILELKNLKDDFGTTLISASIDKKYKKIETFKFKAAIDWRTTFKYLKLSLMPFGILFIIF